MVSLISFPTKAYCKPTIAFFLLCPSECIPAFPIDKQLTVLVYLPLNKICKNVYSFSMLLAMWISIDAFERKPRRKNI